MDNPESSFQHEDNILMSLQERECAVLHLLARDLSDQQIADTLHIGPNHAHGIIEQLQNKTNSRTRKELVDFAIRYGFMEKSW